MSNLKWFGDDILKQVRQDTPEALFESAEMFIESASSKAPVGGSGDLAKSGYVASAKKSTYKADSKNRKEVKPKGEQVIAAFAVFYAKFVEYGTANTRAQPFFRPAFDELKGRMVDTAALHIKAKLK